MRELKFRCWKQEIDAEDNGMIPAENLAFKEYAPIYELLKDSHTHKFMQYTGLKDKNGTEIYEEDIVKSKRYIGVIKYLHGGYYISTVQYLHFLPLDRSSSSDLLVIGNAYENPGLLE